MDAVRPLITRHVLRDDTDEEARERWEWGAAYQAIFLPDEPMTPLEVMVATERAAPARFRRIQLRARNADGRLLGRTFTSFDPDDRENPHVSWASLDVHPDHRRRGVGTALFDALLELAAEEGRTTVMIGTNGYDPDGAAFAAAKGGRVVSHDHVNKLEVADTDREMLEQWVAEAATRSADYDLIGWDGAVSDDDLERWIGVVLIMNTAPRDDMPINDWTLTPEKVREGDAIRDAQRYEHWTLVARHRATGDWVGFHDVTWRPSDPTAIWVGATAVHPDHRGHALGKWLKAAMMLRVLDERPQATRVITSNADSNDAMLGINRAMGYKPWIEDTTWAFDVRPRAV